LFLNADAKDAPMSRDRQIALDAWLAAAARAGDRQAQAQMVRRWQPRLAGHAWRLLGDVELARDAVQDAWVEIFAGLGRLRDDRAFAAWAFRIVTRRCARLVRGRQAERRLGEMAAAQPDMTEPPDPDARLDAQHVRRAMETLPADQRAAMWLFYIQDLSIAETAIALDVPAGTVKTRLMHARLKLRSALEGDDNE